jgi:hypothetical protein
LNLPEDSSVSDSLTKKKKVSKPKWRGRYLTNLRPRTIGFDCETSGRDNPQIVLLTYSGVYVHETETFEPMKERLGKHDLLPAFIEYPTLEQTLDFLYSHIPNHKTPRKNYLCVFYNTRYDFSIMIKNALIDENRFEEKFVRRGKPSTEEIRNLAIELSLEHSESYTTPEDSELKEDGFWDEAKKLLSREERIRIPLIAKSWIEGKEIVVGNYFIKYWKNKAFSIAKIKRDKLGTVRYRKDGKPRTSKTRIFYDCAAFFKEDNHAISLDVAAERFLEQKKFEGIDREKLGTDIEYYKANRDKIISYSIRDCELTARLMDLIVESQAGLYRKVFNKFDIYPAFYFSTGSLAKAWLELEHKGLKYSGYLYAVHELELIQKCYRGAMTDAWKLGRWQKVSIVDLNSAYPSAMRDLPNPIALAICRVNKYHPGKVLGYYKVETYHNQLIPRKIQDLYLAYPGDARREKKIITYLGRQAVEYLWERGDPVKILEGIEFANYANLPLEFEDVSLLYTERQNEKDAVVFKGDIHDLTQLGIKLVLNSAYGSLEQLKNGSSAFTNLLFGQYITENCRVRLWRLIDKVGIQNVVFLATDSLAYIDNGQLDSMSFSKKLGELSKQLNRGEVIVYKSGVYFKRSCDCKGRGRDDLQCLALSKEAQKNRVQDISHWTLKHRGYPQIDEAALLTARGNKFLTRYKHVITIDEGANSPDIKSIGKFITLQRTLNLENIRLRRIVEDTLDFETLNHFPVNTEPLSIHDPLFRKEEAFSSLPNEFVKRKIKYAPDYSCFSAEELKDVETLKKKNPFLRTRSYAENRMFEFVQVRKKRLPRWEEAQSVDHLEGDLT